MEPFPPSNGKEYILVAVDYVFKWVKAIPTMTNDHQEVIRFIIQCIFTRYDLEQLSLPGAVEEVRRTPPHHHAIPPPCEWVSRC